MASKEQLESMVCTELDSNVIYAVSDGTSEMTYRAKYTKRFSIPGAPLECPLLSPPHMRKAAQFIICEQCPYGTFKPTEAENSGDNNDGDSP